MLLLPMIPGPCCCQRSCLLSIAVPFLHMVEVLAEKGLIVALCRGHGQPMLGEFGEDDAGKG